MKKIFLFPLVLVLAISITGCGKAEEVITSNIKESIVVENFESLNETQEVLNKDVVISNPFIGKWIFYENNEQAYLFDISENEITQTVFYMAEDIIVSSNTYDKKDNIIEFREDDIISTFEYLENGSLLYNRGFIFEKTNLTNEEVIEVISDNFNDKK